MHLFLKKIYRKNPFPKIYRINQCEVLNRKLLENRETRPPQIKNCWFCSILIFFKNTKIVSIPQQTKG